MSTFAWCCVLVAICVVLIVLLLTTPLYDMVSPHQVPIGILCMVGAFSGVMGALMAGGGASNGAGDGAGDAAAAN